jgi:hypothetical protein
MNRAVGFRCPICGRGESDVLRLKMSQVGHPMSIRLHCSRCEAVFVETLHRQEAERGHMSSARTGSWRRDR